MHLGTLRRRSLAYHWRTNAAVVLGVAVGSAVLTGALVVGDSMRGSLREAALGRLGRIDEALVSSGFFREELAPMLARVGADGSSRDVSGAILLSAAAIHADSRARVGRINLLGVDESFWNLRRDSAPPAAPSLSGRSVVLNDRLADDLGASIGDDILIVFERPGAVSTESLLGRRDETAAALRLTIKEIIAARDIGALTLSPRQTIPRNAYVAVDTLQRAIDRRNRINAMFVAGSHDGRFDATAAHAALERDLIAAVEPTDLGMTVRINAELGYAAVESESMLIPPPADSVVRQLGPVATGVITYLANAIEKDPQRSIPYSTVSAIDPSGPIARSLTLVEGGTGTTLKPGEILLNAWAADDLNAKIGDDLTLRYFVTGPFGRLETRDHRFRLAGVVELKAAAADIGFTPPYHGVTDAVSLSAWDPPFPMDLSVIRSKDEAYWDKYRTAPKAFVTLSDGQRLWSHDAERLGRFTSIRLYPPEPPADWVEYGNSIRDALRDQLDPGTLGLSFNPIRRQLTTASKGTTDFGMLFIGFSFFLIASAAMLVSLLFRLGVERRSSEIGLLLATGFSRRRVAGLCLSEGAVLAAIGCLVGTAASTGYAWLMLAGLRTWWAGAANTPFVRIHVEGTTLLIGTGASLLVALGSIAWSVRGLTRIAPRALLAGAWGALERVHHPTRFAGRLAAAALAAAILLALSPKSTDAVPASIAFFGSGAAALVAGLAIFAACLRRERAAVIESAGATAYWRLGTRNARRRAGRSTLTASLIASATFLIASLQAFHLDADAQPGARASRTGGFVLYAESAAPLTYDVNTNEGRDALGITPQASATLASADIVPFRLRTGDESSCLNLYTPTNPRILGATPRLIERGGFVFSKTLARSDAERSNPWRLLEQTFADGAIPVIGDEAAVLWQLHLGLGRDLVIQDDRGRDRHLRFVALMGGCALQDELIVSEESFKNLFPSIGGYSFFLIETPPDKRSAVELTLERELSRFGLDVSDTRTRLAGYLSVQNTYLSTFQTLGGFGLLLGSVGLAAVLLRNVWERRGELALMRAVGFSKNAIGWIVLLENTSLLLIGLGVGLASALLAIAPTIAEKPGTIAWGSLTLTLVGVLATGLIAGGVATALGLRGPLMPALRAE